MRKFHVTKKTIAKGSSILLAGAMLVVSGCKASEVLDFYKVLTAGSTFDNYEYVISIESQDFAKSLENQPMFEKTFDAMAVKGIVTNDSAFSASVLVRIDGEYSDITSVVIRDDRIYIDLGSVFDTIKKISPDSYKQIQTSIDSLKAQIDQDPKSAEEAFKQYGLTADEVRKRLDNLGWFYVSFSTIDKGIDYAKDASETIKDAMPIDTIEALDDSKYPEAVKAIVQKIGNAVEARFGKVEPSFSGYNKDANEYTFHLYNDNMDAFLDACTDFATDDLIPLIDDSIAVFKDGGIKDGADALDKIKQSLNEKQSHFDYETEQTVESTVLENVITSLKDSKKSFDENKDKVDFDFLSSVSLNGGDGERVWKLKNTMSMKNIKSVNNDVVNNDIVGKTMSSVDIADTMPDSMTVTVTFSMKEFKDAAAAIAAMPDPANEAFSLDESVSTFMTTLGSTRNQIDFAEKQDDVGTIDDYVDYDEPAFDMYDEYNQVITG